MNTSAAGTSEGGADQREETSVDEPPSHAQLEEAPSLEAPSLEAPSLEAPSLEAPPEGTLAAVEPGSGQPPQGNEGKRRLARTATAVTVGANGVRAGANGVRAGAKLGGRALSSTATRAIASGAKLGGRTLSFGRKKKAAANVVQVPEGGGGGGEGGGDGANSKGANADGVHSALAEMGANGVSGGDSSRAEAPAPSVDGVIKPGASRTRRGFHPFSRVRGAK